MGPGTLSAVQVTMGTAGVEYVDLTVTDRYSGDNYRVDMSSDAQPPNLLNSTGVITAWKRLYIERDKMYRKGAFLSSNYAAGDDHIELMDASSLSVGDAIDVLDSAHPSPEHTSVVAIVGNTLTIDPVLTCSYDAGLGVTGCYAAVGVPSGGYYQAPTDRLPQGYDDAFVEWTALPNGSAAVPLQYDQTEKSQRRRFWQEWCQNRGKLNYIYLCGASKGSSEGDVTPGVSVNDENWTFIYWRAVGGSADGNAWDAQRAIVSADATVHELGHQCNLSKGLFDHIDREVDNLCQDNHLSTDCCVMDYESDEYGPVSEFCTDCLWHVRKQPDSF